MDIEMKKAFFNRLDKYKEAKEFQPFYQGISENKLYVQKCVETDRYIWPPRTKSPYSPYTNIIWEEVEGIGTVYTYNVVYRAFHPYFTDKVPYVIGIVELDEGIRMLGNILVDAEKVTIGTRVKASFEEVEEGKKLVHWTEV